MNEYFEVNKRLKVDGLFNKRAIVNIFFRKREGVNCV